MRLEAIVGVGVGGCLLMLRIVEVVLENKIAYSLLHLGQLLPLLRVLFLVVLVPLIPGLALRQLTSILTFLLF